MACARTLVIPNNASSCQIRTLLRDRSVMFAPQPNCVAARRCEQSAIGTLQNVIIQPVPSAPIHTLDLGQHNCPRRVFIEMNGAAWTPTSLPYSARTIMEARVNNGPWLNVFTMPSREFGTGFAVTDIPAGPCIIETRAYFTGAGAPAPFGCIVQAWTDDLTSCARVIAMPPTADSCTVRNHLRGQALATHDWPTSTCAATRSCRTHDHAAISGFTVKAQQDTPHADFGVIQYGEASCPRRVTIWCASEAEDFTPSGQPNAIMRIEASLNGSSYVAVNTYLLNAPFDEESNATNVMIAVPPGPCTIKVRAVIQNVSSGTTTRMAARFYAREEYDAPCALTVPVSNFTTSCEIRDLLRGKAIITSNNAKCVATKVCATSQRGFISIPQTVGAVPAPGVAPVIATYDMGDVPCPRKIIFECNAIAVAGTPSSPITFIFRISINGGPFTAVLATPVYEFNTSFAHFVVPPGPCVIDFNVAMTPFAQPNSVSVVNLIREEIL